jgi:hypothetical protein
MEVAYVEQLGVRVEAWDGGGFLLAAFILKFSSMAVATCRAISASHSSSSWARMLSSDSLAAISSGVIAEEGWARVLGKREGEARIDLFYLVGEQDRSVIVSLDDFH